MYLCLIYSFVCILFVLSKSLSVHIGSVFVLMSSQLCVFACSVKVSVSHFRSGYTAIDRVEQPHGWHNLDLIHKIVLTTSMFKNAGARSQTLANDGYICFLISVIQRKYYG